MLSIIYITSTSSVTKRSSAKLKLNFSLTRLCNSEDTDSCNDSNNHYNNEDRNRYMMKLLLLLLLLLLLVGVMMIVMIIIIMVLILKEDKEEFIGTDDIYVKIRLMIK